MQINVFKCSLNSMLILLILICKHNRTGLKILFELQVDNLELTDEQKRCMPSTRQKNSLLAIGRNLATLPDEASSVDLGTRAKRARSLSGDGLRGAGNGGKLVRTRSVGGSVTSLLELGEVCEREREKIQVDSLVPSATSAAPSTVEQTTQQPPLIKPPTPVCFLLNTA